MRQRAQAPIVLAPFVATSCRRRDQAPGPANVRPTEGALGMAWLVMAAGAGETLSVDPIFMMKSPLWSRYLDGVATQPLNKMMTRTTAALSVITRKAALGVFCIAGSSIAPTSSRQPRSEKPDSISTVYVRLFVAPRKGRPRRKIDSLHRNLPFHTPLTLSHRALPEADGGGNIYVRAGGRVG